MCRLAVGPLSSEIIEAVYRHPDPLMLIVSKNQADHSGGYVNNWTTKDYVSELKRFEEKYSKKVLICRDHCGPGFNKVFLLDDSYMTVEDDIANGFDLIHFDFCHHGGDKMEETKRLIEFALNLKKDLLIEIGTDENVGVARVDIEDDIKFFTSFCKPDFYVVQTGSLVMEMKQVGVFDEGAVRRSSDIVHSFGMKLKEHNADYLDGEGIKKRRGIVDAMNIAPQLGVVQTMSTLTQCVTLGIDVTDFLNKSYESGQWGKWFDREADKTLCAIVSGHYNFASDEYRRIHEKISKEVIIEEITKVIELYVNE